MSSPYLITSLPPVLSGITYELVIALHQIVLARGKPGPENAKRLTVVTPDPVTLSVAILPDKLVVWVTRIPGRLFKGRTQVVLLTADGHNYIAFDTDVRIEEMQRIAQELAVSPAS